MTAIKKSQVAEEIPFDNDTNGFIADDTQGAIEEVNNNIQTSASPGFSFGRSGNVSSNTWLNCEGVPSNKSGRYVYITNALVSRVFVSSEEVSTFSLEVYYNDKGGTGLNLLGTVTVTTDYGDAFSVNWSVPTDKELAVKLVGGSAKNVVAGLELRGSV
jgi:hypothetical protein